MQKKKIILLFMIFTVLYGTSFAVLKSFFDPFDAFILATVFCGLLGTGTYIIREGLDYESNFTNLELKGKMTVKKPQDASEQAEFVFADNFQLTGKVTGKIS